MNKINARTKCGYTALHFASSGEYKEIAELLINAGIEINAKDNNGKTALDFASWSGNLEIFDLLTELTAIE